MPHIHEPSQMAQLSAVIPPELNVATKPPVTSKPAMPAIPKTESKSAKLFGVPKLSIVKRTVDPAVVMRHLFQNGASK